MRSCSVCRIAFTVGYRSSMNCNASWSSADLSKESSYIVTYCGYVYLRSVDIGVVAGRPMNNVMSAQFLRCGYCVLLIMLWDIDTGVTHSWWHHCGSDSSARATSTISLPWCSMPPLHQGAYGKTSRVAGREGEVSIFLSV